MAFAAVISLQQTLMHHIHSSPPSIFSPARKLLRLALDELVSLRQVLRRSDDSSGRGGSRKTLNALEGLIGEEVNELEAFFDYEESKQFFVESGGEAVKRMNQQTGKKKKREKQPSIRLEEIRRKLISFAETVKKMKEEYIKELDNITPDAEEEDDDHAAAVGAKMVGISDDFEKIKKHVLKRMRPDDSGVFSIVGMAGSGRTSVAEHIYYELLSFDGYLGCSAWVTVRPEYGSKEILQSILAQIQMRFSIPNSADNKKLLAEHLCASLKGRRYLIVLDDVSDPQIWGLLKSSFPEQENGSLVLLTTSQIEVAQAVGSLYIHEMYTFPDGDSLDFFNQAAFHGNCPPEFLVAGEKIAKKCRGLRIPLAKVALILCEAEKNPQYWNELAADEENSIFRVADEISELRMMEIKLQRLAEHANNEGMNSTVTEVSRLLNIHNVVGEVKSRILTAGFSFRMDLMSLFGMVGIGKTALANQIYNDALVVRRFDHRVWIKLGPKYQSEDIVVDILAQIYPYINKMNRDPHELQHLQTALFHKRCLIVLDDVWDKELIQYLRMSLTYIKGMILVTTRLAEVAREGNGSSNRVHNMRLLNKEESWDLLREKVFGKDDECPPQLKKAGKKIAEKCDGLPLLILAVAKGLLSEGERIPEDWDNEANKRNSLVFTKAQNEISMALLPSYMSLPQHLKPCFLYMGVFPPGYEIFASKLIKLWIGEGLLDPNPLPEIDAARHLSELSDRSLVMICQKGFNFKTKTCRLHSVFWHLSNDEATSKKFFHALNSYADNSAEPMMSNSRLCIRNNILLGIKYVHDLMASVATARSLLCTGQPNPYEVPIDLGLRFLKVLDVLTIRFYSFPIEVLKLIHLRYLALTYNGNLPDSISNLWKLEYLILSRHLSIKSSHDSSSYLPVQIWDLKELRHLQIMGSSLPNPHFGALLPKLSTVLDMNARSCTRGILEKISNLRRLGIQIELAPNDDGKAFHYLNHISNFRHLESLKCVVVNPELVYEVVTPPCIPASMFPSSLKKLSLSGLGYPWEYMSIIGKLQQLEELKLKCYAFQGPYLETNGSDFERLQFLLIQDTDLECWEIKLPRFNRLRVLSIRHCYNLKKLPDSLPPIVEMIDCNPIIMSWAKQREEKHLKNSSNWRTQFDVHSSFDGKDLKK